MAVKIAFRNDTSTQWSSVNPILEAGEMGVETNTGRFKIGNGVATWSSRPYADVQGAVQTNRYRSLGDGSDGDVVISSGTVTLTQDMYYNNLTISGSGKLVTANYKVFVKNTLDLSNAGVGAIQNNGDNGGNASGNTGGVATAVLPAASLGTFGQGSAGATGVVGAGVQSASPGSITGNGGATNTAGAGGSGTSAGTGGGGGTTPTACDVSTYMTNLFRGVTLIGGGVGGRGGSSGGGDGSTNAGGGGGAAGNGGGVVAIYANTILTSASTASRCITATGGNGGNGANGPAVSTGGGGGGSGGGGGWITIFYNKRQGPTIASMLDASGGAGGRGGDGNGVIATSGALSQGGGRGSGGYGGRISLFRIPDSYGLTYFAVSDITFNPRVTPSTAAQVDGIGKDGGIGGRLFGDF